MPIETDVGTYANHKCKCHICGRIELATFRFDYYPTDVVAPDGRRYLMCEYCMMGGRGREMAPRPFSAKHSIEEFIEDVN